MGINTYVCSTKNDEVEITKEWVDELKEKGLLQ